MISRQIYSGKLCIRSNRSRPGFIEDIVKNILVSFSPDTVYIDIVSELLVCVV